MDMESEDYAFYKGLVFLMENNIEDLGYELNFSAEIQEFGVTSTRDLKPNGRNIIVTEESKKEYVKLVCQMKMTGAIRQQVYMIKLTIVCQGTCNLVSVISNGSNEFLSAKNKFDQSFPCRPLIHPTAHTQCCVYVYLCTFH